jgi:hypothetical protein
MDEGIARLLTKNVHYLFASGMDLALIWHEHKELARTLAWIWHEQDIEMAGIWHGFNFGQCIKLAWT